MRQKTHFACSQCGNTTPKWQGKCDACGSWNSIQEEVAPLHGNGGSGGLKRTFGGGQAAIPLDQVSSQPIPRIYTGISELDRVLGGGLVPGSLTLLSGEPGIGKSTLVLQTLHALACRGFSVLYATGEESLEQVRLRAERLNTLNSKILLMNETNLQMIEQEAQKQKPTLLVVDSIQTVFKPQLESSPGTVSQLRECAADLMHLAKGKQIAILVIGHVTKEGSIAGPKVLEHLVDTILNLEGEPHSGHRVLRSLKNRFGSTGEIGVFGLTATGLKDISNPSELFLSSDIAKATIGSAVGISLEGTRPLLVEVQALVGKTTFSIPKRVVSGLDSNRLSILTAVLEKRAGLFLSTNDIYAGAAGGLRLVEPALDLALAAALTSSLLEKPIPAKVAFFGEVGLTGELRSCSYALLRLNEAAKMGLGAIIMPKRNFIQEKDQIHKMLISNQSDLQIYPLEFIWEMVEFLNPRN
jgi:DNA repair protein RadA/Sms